MSATACRDKLKFGGLNRLRRRCAERVCTGDAAAAGVVPAQLLSLPAGGSSKLFTARHAENGPLSRGVGENTILAHWLSDAPTKTGSSHSQTPSTHVLFLLVTMPIVTALKYMCRYGKNIYYVR